MKKKLNKLAGFTLAELLIVVAIIGVLVAISIPIFTSRLEASRESTDAANLRSAYAAATTALLTGKYDHDSADAGVGGTTNVAGKLQGSGKLYYCKDGKLSSSDANAMSGKSKQDDYQGEDMDDFPDGIHFEQGNFTTEYKSKAGSEGNSGNKNIAIYITKGASGAADRIDVYFEDTSIT